VKRLVAGCLVLGALSLLVSSAPGNDPWAWVVWGREVVHLDLDTSIGASWKPLPVLFTAPFSLFGDWAPALWIVVARAGALLGLVLAFRLAYRLALSGERPPRNERLAAIGAGVLAAVPLALAVELTSLGGKAGLGYARYLSEALTEGLFIAFLLWAVDRELDGRRDQALVLGLLAALLRPEVWPFFGGYAVFVALREPRRRPLVAAVIVAVPALWILPEWWGSGDPLGAGSRAAKSAREMGVAGDPVAVLKRMNALLIGPVELAVLVALGFAARRRELAPLALAAGAGLWVAGAALATLFGYPGIARFLLPAAAILFVLGGLGAARIVQALGSGPAALALGVVLVLAASPFAGRSVRKLPDIVESGRQRTELKRDLARALEDVGGPQAVLPCGRPVIAALVRYAPDEPVRSKTGWPRNYIAWELDVHIDQVRRRIPRTGGPAVVIHGGRRELGLAPPAPVVAGQEVRQLAEVGVWQVFLFADPARPPPGCQLVAEKPGRPARGAP
jgi:hypothetical protein